MRWQLLLVFALGLLVAADDPKDAVKKELKSIEGTWRVTGFELNGNRIDVNGWNIVVKGDKYKLTYGDHTEEGTFKIDAAKKPKTVEVTAAGSDTPRKGIYQLDGDTAKACFATAGDERPKEFATKPDSGHYLWELARDK